MKTKLKILFFACIVASLFASCGCSSKESCFNSLLSKQSDFYNLINIKNVPRAERDYEAFVFSDQGAWSGYALPENEANRYAGAFIGPMTMAGGRWIAASLAIPSLTVDGDSYSLARNVRTVKYFPGRLRQEFGDERLRFVTELCFVTSRTALVHSTVENISTRPVSVSLTWRGGVFNSSSNLNVVNKSVVITRPVDSISTVIRFCTADAVTIVGKDSLQAVEKENFILQPDAVYTADYTQTLMLRGEDIEKEITAISGLKADSCFAANEECWNKRLSALLNHSSKYLKDNRYRRVMAKAMITLNTNWRSPAGDILHAGSYPSYNGFFGIWSWDSWKIASANVFYNPEMAKDEMRTLFDYQAENGMIPDLIGYNKKRNNWRDSKPPLAAWGVMNVYRETGDRTFLSEMFDKLYKFHRWWYADRDHDKNGVCEYGSTDGTLIAAAWESGMDNGVRFDDVTMLQNGTHAWSMNQENICLNSFLYVEKKVLAEMAVLLNKEETAARLNAEAAKLKEHIQTKMFDKETGFFYDTRLGTGEFVKVMGSECWLPLWAGAATSEQAKQVAEKMLDVSRFNSTLPLGTLDTSDPRLRPVRGYWRGPVWVDQVYFGITGLRNYGFDKEADMLLEKFIANAQGLTADGPIHENYNPLTGEMLNCPNFGWSSALIIKMLLNK